MTDSFRLRVQKQIAVALAEINPTNDYEFDFTNAVFRGRMSFGDGDPCPMLSILEPPVPAEAFNSPANAPSANGEWVLLIQGFVNDDRVNPTDPAHRAMAEVKKRLAVEQKRKQDLPRRGDNPFGLNTPDSRNRLESFKIGAGVVRPPEPSLSNKAYFWLNLTLKIVEDNSDPFS